MQGSSPIGWNCRGFSLVPFYCKTSSHRFLGLINIFFLVGNAPIGQFELLLLIQILAGKFEFWREIWMLAGRLLRSFPVQHFRWLHFLALPVMQLPVTSLLHTALAQIRPGWCFYTWIRNSDPVPTEVSVSLTIKCMYIYKRELGSPVSIL